MRMRRVTGACAALLALGLALAAPALAATAPLIQNVDTSAFPQVSFNLVLPPEAVPVKGDVPEVSVTENGFELPEVTVSSLEKERTEIDVVLLLDASGSMRGGPLADAQAAARRFVDSMGATDRIAIVAFSSQPAVLQSFTADRAALYAAIDSLVAGGETALYDGLVQAAQVAAGAASAERYIVALSDGGDTMSLNSADNAAAAVTEVKAPVYAIALQSPEYNPATLQAIAQASAGRMVSATDSGSLTSIYQSIAEEMQLRYRVRFTSSRPNTADLDLAVTVGSGADAAVTRLAVRNPDFEEGVGLTGSALLPSHPSVAALAITIAAIFGAVGLFAWGAGLMLRRDKAALDQLSYYDNLRAGGAATTTYEDTSVRGGLVGALEAVAERRGLTGKVQRQLEAGGLAFRANEFMTIIALGGVILAIIAFLASGGSLLAVLAAAVFTFAGSVFFLSFKAKGRLKKFENQLPDILDLIAGSLRSGWGVQQAIDLVVDEVADPAKSEFRRTQAEARLGMPFDEALQRMAERVESADLRWAVNAISIQREVGGNLAEVLGIVSGTIRERGELARQVTALTAEGRVSMFVLTVLPFAVFAFLFVVNPEYVMNALASPIGIGAYVLGVGLLFAGIFWLNKIIKIEV